jgi:uncharacterized membrane protein
MTEVLTIAAAVGCGAVGGVFFAFSSFVMRALDRLPAAQGIAAMQSINVVVINPVFMTALFGTGAACVALAIADPSPVVLGAAATYLLGVLGTTMAYNVPRNDALAALDPGAAEAPSAWRRYVREWTIANHVRAVAGLAAAGALYAA